MKRRIIIGISGASGAIYGIRALEFLKKDPGVEAHLILSAASKTTISVETSWEVSDVLALADEVYLESDIGAAIASGSFLTMGMLIAPCSVKTLSAVANSYANNLIARAADVQLKEGRTLVLLLRETPLHVGHIRLMQLAASSGAIIFPPVPAFYSHPQTVDDIINETVSRALLRLGIDNTKYFRWKGVGSKTK